LLQDAEAAVSLDMIVRLRALALIESSLRICVTAHEWWWNTARKTPEIGNSMTREQKMQLPTWRLELVVALTLAVPSFAFFVPIMYIPYSYHTDCTNFGANCRHVSHYGS